MQAARLSISEDFRVKTFEVVPGSIDRELKCVDLSRRLPKSSQEMDAVSVSQKSPVAPCIVHVCHVHLL